MTSISQPSWPIVPGTYRVGDANAAIAVCTLTTEKLMVPLAALSGVAISGMVYTANLGVTRIVQNLTSNTAIRFLLICGRDSALFHPGQSMVALSDNGVDSDQRIVGAAGHDPVLRTLTSEQIAQFRKQIELIDWIGEENFDAIKEKIRDLSARSPGRFAKGPLTTTSSSLEKFETIRPGGQRAPLIYDPKGYFVITVEPEVGEIVVRHHAPDHAPAHEMRGRGATSMLLGLLREGLVTQLSHAGYLGEELAKAQTALQFGLRYDQDRPLRARDTPTPIAATEQKSPAQPPIEPFNLKEFESAQQGIRVNFYLIVTDLHQGKRFRGLFLERDESDPLGSLQRTSFSLEAAWDDNSKMIMGEATEVVKGAILRIAGTKGQNEVHAEQLVILTRVAKIKS